MKKKKSMYLVGFLSAAMLAAGMIGSMPDTFPPVQPVAVSAETVNSGTCGSSVSWNLGSDGTLTISGSGAMTNYSSSTPAPWNSQKSAIKSVIITDGVTSIGNSAFRDCDSIETVSIPDTVTSIGSYAFYDCDKLTKVSFNSRDVYSYAFCSCDNLTTVVMGNTVKYIESNAFYNCKNLSNVTWSNNLTGIRSSAFWGTGLTELQMPDTVTTVGERAFAYSPLKNVHLSTSLTTLESGAFLDCDGLTAIEIPASLTKATEDYYSGDVTDNDEKVSSGYIGPFSHCDNLKGITFANGTTTVPGYLFYNCDSIETVSIPDTITSIGTYAFYDCDKLTKVSFNSRDVYSYAFCSCDNLTTVVMGNTVKYIESNAFYNCKNLSNVTWSNNLTGIRSSAFWGTGLTELQMPDTVTTVGERAFAYSPLKNVHLSTSLTTLESGAFLDCDGLTAIEIPASLTKATEDYYSGDVTDNDEKVSSGYIGPFSHCDNLKGITFANGTTTVPGYLFYNCDSIESIYIPKSAGSIGTSAFEGCENLIAVNIPDKVETIGNYAFRYCSNLTHIHIPEGKTYSDYAGKGSLPSEPSYYFPGGCGKDNCPLNGKVAGYELDTSLKNIDRINYSELTGYDKSAYNLSYFIRADADYDSIDGLIVRYELSDGFSFSENSNVNTKESIVEAYKIYDIWETFSDSLTIYPTGGFVESVTIKANVYNGSNLIVSDSETIPVGSEVNFKDYESEITINTNGYNIASGISYNDEDIIYNESTKEFNQTSYNLGFSMTQDIGENKSIDGLTVVFGLAHGFSFSPDSSEGKIQVTVKDNHTSSASETFNMEQPIYPDKNFDYSKIKSADIVARIYDEDQLIGTAVMSKKIQAEKTDNEETASPFGTEINSSNISDFKDKNGDLIIESGDYYTSGNVSCKNLYIKGGTLTVSSKSVLTVSENAEVTGGKEQFLIFGSDEKGGELSVYGTLNVNGNMTIGKTFGVLKMTSSKSCVDVKGDLTFNAKKYDSHDTLTNGVLKIGGSFYGSKNTGNFQASGDHVTQFYSSDSFKIEMNTKLDSNNTKNSYFNNLIFTDEANDNFNGTINTFNVKGYFRLNQKNGEDLKTKFADYVGTDEAVNAIQQKFSSFYDGKSSYDGTTSSLATSLGSASKYLSNNSIKEIAASTEMFFELEVMNEDNNNNIKVEGLEIRINKFNKLISFENVPLKNSKDTVNVYVYLDASGTGLMASTSLLCSATWFIMNKDITLSGTAVMTYSATDSLYNDLRKIYNEKAHGNDYWYWCVQVANDFLGGYNKLSGAKAFKNAQTALNIVDKCVESVKKGNVDPFLKKFTDGNQAVKLFENMNKVVDGKISWIEYFKCPVDVEVRDENGQVVGLIQNNTVKVTTEDVQMSVSGDTKIIKVSDIGKYSIKVTGTDTGTVDYKVDEVVNGMAYRRISFDALPVDTNTVYEGTAEFKQFAPAENYRLIDYDGNYYYATSDVMDMDGNEITALPGEVEYHSVYIPENVTVTVNGISIEDKGCVCSGDVLTITAAQVEGSKLFSLKVNGNDFANGGTYTVENEDIEITVEYQELGIDDDNYIKGDVNGDGKIDILDLATMRRHLAGNPTEIDEKAADLDGNGDITILDLAILRRYLAGNEEVLK